MPVNRRVKKAGTAIKAYQETTDTNLEALTDLLADLAHWARVNGVDYQAAVRIAGDHVVAESAREIVEKNNHEDCTCMDCMSVSGDEIETED